MFNIANFQLHIIYQPMIVFIFPKSLMLYFFEIFFDLVHQSLVLRN